MSTVLNNYHSRRYEIYEDGRLVGFLQYRVEHDELWLVHTEVWPEYQRRGLATLLVREVLEVARQQRLSVTPVCPFVRRQMLGQEQYLRLVPPDARTFLDRFPVKTSHVRSA